MRHTTTAKQFRRWSLFNAKEVIIVRWRNRHYSIERLKIEGTRWPMSIGQLNFLFVLPPSFSILMIFYDLRYMSTTIPAGIPAVGLVLARLVVKDEFQGLRWFLVDINDGTRMCPGIAARYAIHPAPLFIV